MTARYALFLKGQPNVARTIFLFKMVTLLPQKQRSLEKCKFIFSFRVNPFLCFQVNLNSGSKGQTFFAKVSIFGCGNMNFKDKNYGR